MLLRSYFFNQPLVFAISLVHSIWETAIHYVLYVGGFISCGQKMASVEGYPICVFCLQPGASMSDPRKLPCGHIGCFSCIQQVLKMAKEFECPSCSFKCEVVDVHKLEIAAYTHSISEGSDQMMCGVCGDKLAKVFCVKCQKPLCAMHRKEDDERAVSGGYAVHYHVKMGAYVANKDLYIRHYCKRHSDTETIQACSSCFDTFCRSCDAAEKCTTTNDLHKLTLLPEVVTVLHRKINQLRASMDEKNARCLSFLKRTYKQMESFEKTAIQMVEEVDRVMNEQIEQIKLEAGKVKDEIAKYKEKFSTKGEENIKQLLKFYGQVAEGLSNLNTAAMIKSAGRLVENYSMIEGRIKATLSIDITPAHIVRSRLVPTGLFKKLEVRLCSSEVSAIEYKKTTEKISGYYKIAKWISADRLVTAGNQGVELRDGELNLINSISIPYVQDVIRYQDQLIVLQALDKKTKSVQLYSMQLVKVRDIVSFSTDYGYSESHIAASDENIVVSDPSYKCLYIFTLQGMHGTSISLRGMRNSGGVCITADGCLLISNQAEKGFVRKYKFGGDYQLLWESDVLEYPRGISESEFGDLFVSKYENKKNALYQLSADGKLLKTVTCDHLAGVNDLYDASVMDDCLAVACSYDGVKLFHLTFSS